ncbi:MAG: DUF3604 domain-containing protein [Pseudomonadota bacterium]
MRLVLTLLVIVGLTVSGLWAASSGRLGRVDGPGSISLLPGHSRNDPSERAFGIANIKNAHGLDSKTLIRFGDPRVYTTVSDAAFLISLPVFGGRGAATLGDACDFARYCSAVDFWAITDHAESLTPNRWQQTLEGAAQCTEVAASQSEAHDVFVGFSWPFDEGNGVPAHAVLLNQFGTTAKPPQPPRYNLAATARTASTWQERVALTAQAFSQRVLDFAAHSRATRQDRTCRADNLDGCADNATFEDALRTVATEPGDVVSIAVDNTVGEYLTRAAHTELNAATELFEIYSGRGSAEIYRPLDWSELARHATCPAPTSDYLAPCWRAGELIALRCAADGGDPVTCEQRAAAARAVYARVPIGGHLLFREEAAAAWRDAGQCRNCFMPAFDYRDRGSAQYRLAKRNFTDDGSPVRHYLGFVAASASHRARPGNGYKERDRFLNTDAVRTSSEALFERVYGSNVSADEDFGDLLAATSSELGAEPARFAPVADVARHLAEHERAQSFLYSGGLTGVHALDSSRTAIWQALATRSVYATSGDRILLWFEAGAAENPVHPMGSRLVRTVSPSFRVVAAGAFKQLPGCPKPIADSIGDDRLGQLCAAECFNESEERKLISRIEVVRVRPQSSPDEPIADLIDDPWLTHVCEPDPLGCEYRFSDPDYQRRQRDTTYYVRAIASPSLAINGAGLRCEYDADGQCIATTPCRGELSNPDCLAPVEERAWSSPIYLEWAN